MAVWLWCTFAVPVWTNSSSAWMWTTVYSVRLPSIDHESWRREIVDQKHILYYSINRSLSVHRIQVVTQLCALCGRGPAQQRSSLTEMYPGVWRTAALNDLLAFIWNLNRHYIAAHTKRYNRQSFVGMNSFSRFRWACDVITVCLPSPIYRCFPPYLYICVDEMFRIVEHIYGLFFVHSILQSIGHRYDVIVGQWNRFSSSHLYCCTWKCWKPFQLFLYIH